ncbi:EF-hand calcium-binding domain-containing protein 14-like [Dendropsophus ebraccatus]|uniref:EF-hand calcium-binding domain-containing protein 14-like n=1 Tax=Dendropsophus ebraccatus TaxID=150705 RepID=UPI0038320664
MKSTQSRSRSTVQSVTEPLTHAPPTTLTTNAEVPDSLPTESILNGPSTVPTVSKEKEEPREQHNILTSFLKTRADFQVFFYGADKDADGYLTYEEIKNVLGGETPSEELLQHFDTDQDTLYSYTELMRTFLSKVESRQILPNKKVNTLMCSSSILPRTMSFF